MILNFPGGFPPITPANATKPLLFCCVRCLAINCWGGSPANPCAHRSAPALRARLRDGAQSQQNKATVSFAFRQRYSFPKMLLNDDITSRPRLSTLPTARIRPAAFEFRFQLLVSHSIDHGNNFAAVIQCPPYALDITVLFQQLNGIYLAHRVRSDVLT